MYSATPFDMMTRTIFVNGTHVHAHVERERERGYEIDEFLLDTVLAITR